MQSRRNAVVGVNPITAKNNARVTLHLDDEECGSDGLAPHGELLEDGARLQVEGSAAIDEHPRDRLLVNVTSNVQQL
jgi:hypothetical protein